MKKLFSFLMVACALMLATQSHAQDKSKRPSPPDSVSQKLSNGTTVTINYSRPALKGRTIGTDVEPKAGQVWRMGANEATVFEVDHDVMVEGKKLPAGKYSMFGLMGDNTFTIILNKAWKIWGTTYNDHKDEDALRVDVKPQTNKESVERLTYTIDKNGMVNMMWGTLKISFKVK